MADEVVSSIAALSESICEKVDELKHMHSESDSNDVQIRYSIPLRKYFTFNCHWV